MKIKYFIILPVALILLVILCQVAWKFLLTVMNERQPLPSEPVVSVISPFVARIENEIDSLSKMPVSSFSNDFYHTVQYHIDDGYQNSSFGNSENENTSWNRILSEKLYYTYTAKFITQAFYVFNRPEWEPSKLELIGSEAASLQNSDYLDAESHASNRLTEIQDILKKYKAILYFINEANRYMKTGDFDLDKSGSYLSKAQQYRHNNPGNRYVDNCRRLHVALNELPRMAYAKHLNHIARQVNTNLDIYRNDRYSGTNWAQKASDYRNRIFDPITDEIKLFEAEMENTYHVSDNDPVFISLKNKWEQELSKAIDYFKTGH